MKFVFSMREVRDILISAIVLSFAFALAHAGGVLNGVDLTLLPQLVLFSFIAVGIGFLAHELIGHKFFAQRYDLHAEYRMWPTGLVIALASSLAGFVFAAPGAVYIGQRYDMWGAPIPVSRRKMGITSVMGPIVNVAIALAFLALNALQPSELFSLGAAINAWLALFNMIPIPPLDGSKVFFWNKKVFLVVIAAIIALFAFVAL